MKQFTLLLELCQKTQKPLQSRDNSKNNPGKMKIRRTTARNPGQKRGGSGNMKNESTGCSEIRRPSEKNISNECSFYPFYCTIHLL